MMVNSEAFDANLSAWGDWQSTPWRHMSYSIARANLNRHPEPRTLRVLDVGGGNGLCVASSLCNRCVLCGRQTFPRSLSRVYAVSATTFRTTSSRPIRPTSLGSGAWNGP